MDPCSHTYDFDAIDEWFMDNDTSPVTGQAVEHKQLTPNYALKTLVEVRGAGAGMGAVVQKFLTKTTWRKARAADLYQSKSSLPTIKIVAAIHACHIEFLLQMFIPTPIISFYWFTALVELRGMVRSSRPLIV